MKSPKSKLSDFAFSTETSDRMSIFEQEKTMKSPKSKLSDFFIIGRILATDHTHLRQSL